jgi:PAS domain S-box-containing protein
MVDKDKTRQKMIDGGTPMEREISMDWEDIFNALASVVDSMYLVDRECRYLFANDIYLKRRGITLNEIIGRRYDDFHSAGDAGIFREKVKIVYDTGKPIQYEYISEKDGNFFFRTFNPVMDQEGKSITAVTIASQNITDRKRLEAQLIQSQKMEALGTLAGGIAHDFNNILSAMTGYAELARMDTDAKNRQDNIDQILLACERGKNLVSQILAFSRKTSQEYKPVEMGNVVKEVIRLLNATLPSTISIRRKIVPEPCIVMGNPVQIQQALMNLCTNAAHAMGDKGGILEVKLSAMLVSPQPPSPSADLKAGHYVKLIVSDTGCGIDPVIVERIFDPFFTTKTTGEGTGLGLSAVYGIVKGHNGTITVKSEPGKGSTFNVYFPRVQTEIKAETTAQETLPKGDGKILFIDDEAELAKMGRMMLESLGYSVVSCADSTEAVEEFLENPGQYDLVITDMTMPGMTGLDVTHAVLRVNPKIPVILCTGYSEIIDDMKAKQVGVREFLMKPIPMNTLATAVRKVLDEAKRS